jgi:hypothetical protein
MSTIWHINISLKSASSRIFSQKNMPAVIYFWDNTTKICIWNLGVSLWACKILWKNYRNWLCCGFSKLWCLKIKFFRLLNFWCSWKTLWIRYLLHVLNNNSQHSAVMKNFCAFKIQNSVNLIARRHYGQFKWAKSILVSDFRYIGPWGT